MAVRERVRDERAISVDARLLRYLIVVVAAALVDIGTSWCLHVIFGVRLSFAAVAGFFVAMAASYPAHSIYSFRRSTAELGLRKFVGFAAAALAVLVIRFFVLEATAVMGEGPFLSLLRLVLALGTSFFLGYFLNKRLVFKS